MSEEHKLWVRNQIENLGCDELFDGHRDGTPLCQKCGCGGNMECGHEPLDEKNGCTLLDEDCPCCSMGHKPMTDAEYDAIAGQKSLF